MTAPRSSRPTHCNSIGRDSMSMRIVTGSSRSARRQMPISSSAPCARSRTGSSPTSRVAAAPQRVEPLANAFKAAAPEREIVPCAGFAEARQWLDKNLGGHDVVLIENDLPDLYERPLRL